MHEDPILKGLIAGNQFPYRLLRAERDAVEGFWKWWWDNCANMSSLQRPETLENNDSILISTSSKKVVDLVTDDFMFSNPLLHLLDNGIFPRQEELDRGSFHQLLVNHLTQNGIKEGTPTVIFTGGGYGAGKTSALQWLTRSNDKIHPIPPKALQGVDYCKQLLPEFSLVQRVADGRASEICQNESRIISDLLFKQLVTEKRTFGWDSSMSNKEQTLEKIEFAKTQGYRVKIIAVLTKLEVAVVRAMERAKQTRRFAPPKYLEDSHRSFWKHLPDYMTLVDEGLILENSGDMKDGGPRMLGRKEAGDNIFKIIDETTYQDYQ
jgi:predicted ABC-type ATPase